MRKARTLVLAGSLAAATIGFTASSVLAYGHADQPIAQVEFSGNCDNPSFWFCAPPGSIPGVETVGLGGIWLWIEVDTGGTADVAGAVCGHNVGGPRGGASSLRGSTTWSTGYIPSFVTLPLRDPTNSYYAFAGFSLPPIPVTQGHYAWQPVSGVSLQVTIAP
jgi:hypothetical protein